MKRLALLFGLCGSLSVCQAEILPYAGAESIAPTVGLSYRPEHTKGSLGTEIDVSVASLLFFNKAQCTAALLAPVTDHVYLRGGAGIAVINGIIPMPISISSGSVSTSVVKPVVPLSIGYQSEGGFFDVGCNLYPSAKLKNTAPAPIVRGGIKF